ncbi:hypothetical protein, partial [Pseudoduganella sp. RAF53_2]|uniref:hypothetical protein n=1 Tax=Pseudoduganella sp. RAF53_2 TaxID=3233060 RepID=UPI003F9C86C0
RYAVAVKRKLSSELFDRLARDPDETVRAAIAHNAKVPIEVLRLLANDDSSLVSSVALARVAS